MPWGLTPKGGAPKRAPPRPPLATAGMPAMPGPIPPVDGAGVVQLCEANVTGVLAVGTAAPPAQAGGTDSGPMDDPEPAAANTGAAPIPPAPPTAPAGPTSPTRPDPKPPRSAEAVAGPAREVSRPPPPKPIKSDSAEAKLPPSSSPAEAMGLDKTEPLRKDVRLLMIPVRPPCAGTAAADDALDDAPDSEEAAAPPRLAPSVSW